MEKAREFQKTSTSASLTTQKPCVDHNKLWEILKEIGIPNHLTCPLRNLCTGQEAIVRTRHGTMNWFKFGKGVREGCISSPCLFNLYAVYIMEHAMLDESQSGIKFSGRNINKLTYADETTLMAERKGELCFRGRERAS